MQGRNFYLFRSLAVFIAVFFSLQYGWERSRDTALERFIIDDLIVAPAAWSLQRLWPDQIVSALGHSLVTPQFRMNVLNGCEGLDVLFLLVAALMAAPLSWSRRLSAMIVGAVMVYGLNQIRIIFLWHLNQTRPDLFGLMHGTVLPLLLIVLLLLFFLACLPRHLIQTI